MLLVVEKVLEVEYATQSIVMQKPIINIRMIAIKIKKSLYINYWDVNNLYRFSMMQKLPTFNFKWVEHILQFNEVFIKNYDEKGKVGYIL